MDAALLNVRTRDMTEFVSRAKAASRFTTSKISSKARYRASTSSTVRQPSTTRSVGSLAKPSATGAPHPVNDAGVFPRHVVKLMCQAGPDFYVESLCGEEVGAARRGR